MKQIAVLVFVACLANGQTSSELPSSSTQTANLPSQRVGPDDLLTISVANCPELTKNFRVSSDGSLVLPLLKQRLAVSGKLPQEIEADLSKELLDEQLLVQPVVSVAVAEYRSLPVSVVGAVRHPVTFQAAGAVNLIDAITRADGLSSDAGSEIIISRSNVPGNPTGALLERIPVKGLLEDANPALNVRLYGGEEIRVPAAGRVYVVGNVKKAGAYPISEDNDTTVLKVLALSEGLLPYTAKQAFIYRRRVGKQSDPDEIPIELTQIMKRKAADIPLRANDILYIPDSTGRKVTAETVKTLSGFGITTMSGLLIWK